MVVKSKSKDTKKERTAKSRMPMEMLRVQPNCTPEEARKHPSLGLVYECPRCKVGHALTHDSPIAGTVKCNLCQNTYKKP